MWEKWPTVFGSERNQKTGVRTSYSSGGFGVCRAICVLGSSWMWTVVDIYVLGAILKSYTGELFICTWNLTWKQLNVNCSGHIRQWRLWWWLLIYLCRGTYLAEKLGLCRIYGDYVDGYILQWRLWRWVLTYLCRGTYLVEKLGLCRILWWLCLIIFMEADAGSLYWRTGVLVEVCLA